MNSLMRPKKEKRIKRMPEQNFFKPANIPQHKLEQINLTVVELEALRLRDKNGYTQQEAAQEMDVSRSTFQRLLASAHQKVAEALIAGKGIKINGGNYSLQASCSRCGREFTLSSREMKRRRHRNGQQCGQEICPDCR